MKIYVLYTGGTIGSWETKKGLAPMPWEIFEIALKNSIEKIVRDKHPSVQLVYDGFHTPLDSTNIQPRQWVDISERILDNYNKCDGFLILHGTDTMAYTSSALSFLLPGITKPVIVTGSQLPLFKAKETKAIKKNYNFLYNTDAIRNILGSISFLTKGIPEVCLFFADKLFRGNRAVKSNANGFVAFESPNFPPLGEYGLVPKLEKHLVLPIPTRSKKMGILKIKYGRTLKEIAIPVQEAIFENNITKIKAELAKIALNINEFAVVPFLIFPAYYDNVKNESLLVSMLENLLSVKPELKGIILNSYGSGNVPDFPTMKKFIENANSKGLIIIDCTQVFAGTVNKNTYATGAWLKDNVISGGDMTPTSALAKLIIQLARKPLEKKSIIEEKMGEVLAGEMTNSYSLSGHQNEFLMPGDRLTSINGKYQFVNTVNGELQILDISTGKEKMISQKVCGTPGRVVMQSYYGLVFYDRNFKELYASKLTGSTIKETYLKIENDGSLAIIDRTNHKVIKVVSDDFDKA